MLRTRLPLVAPLLPAALVLALAGCGSNPGGGASHPDIGVAPATAKDGKKSPSEEPDTVRQNVR